MESAALTRRSAGIRDSSAGAQSRRRHARQGRASPCSASASSSASWSSRRTRTTTPTTRCCGAARCSTCRPRSSRASACPTEHPLAIAAGALLSLLGEGGDRVWVAMTLGSFLWLVWGIYRLGQRRLHAAGRRDRRAAAADALRLRVPRRARLHRRALHGARRVGGGDGGGAPAARLARVRCCSALAGLLRPEAWILAGLYFLWMSVGATWGERARYAALAAIAPLDVGGGRLRRHRRPAVLAALHELVGRGPRPPADAGGDPLGAAVVLLQPRQAAGAARRAAGLGVRAVGRAAAGGDAARAAGERHRDVRADRDRRACR